MRLVRRYVRHTLRTKQPMQFPIYRLAGGDSCDSNIIPVRIKSNIIGNNALEVNSAAIIYRECVAIYVGELAPTAHEQADVVEVGRIGDSVLDTEILTPQSFL